MKCPLCRAENGMETACRRCKADLTLVVGVEARRQRLVVESARCAQAGDGDAALRAARLAHELRPADDSWRLMAVGHLLRRDYRQALRIRARCTSNLRL
jgi:hypothetical protein